MVVILRVSIMRWRGNARSGMQRGGIDISGAEEVVSVSDDTPGRRAGRRVDRREVERVSQSAEVGLGIGIEIRVDQSKKLSIELQEEGQDL